MQAALNIKSEERPTISGKRVLHIVPAMFRANGGVVGGAERYVLELARHMAHSTPTELLSFGPKNEDFKIDQLKVTIRKMSGLVRGQEHNPFCLNFFGPVLQADIIHCHQRVWVNTLSAFLARLTGKKTFFSHLGLTAWDFGKYLPVHRLFHAHLHISEYSRKHFGRSGATNEHLIYGGIDTQKFSPPAIKKPGQHVVYVGRLLPIKGINYLIEAATDPIHLKLVGNPYDERYFKDLKKLAEGKNVEFITQADDTTLIELLQSAYAVVQPSVYKTLYGETTPIPELLGLAILEGMACGVPGICTNVASLPELVEDGRTGFIVPPNDPKVLREKLLFLLQNPEIQLKMGKNAEKKVHSQFTWEKTVERCFRFYSHPYQSEPIPKYLKG